MAVEKSKKLIDLSFEKSVYLPNIKNIFVKKLLKVLLINFFYFYRNFVLLLKIKIIHKILPSIFKKKNISLNINLIDLKKFKEIYQDKNYIYIENFINNDSYNQLNQNFPSKKIYYKLKNDPTKFYYWGFEYLKSKSFLDNDNNLLKCFPELKFYYDFLNTKNFFNSIDLLLNKAGFKNTYQIVSLNCTLAFENSFLIPHKDTSYIADYSELTFYKQIHNIIHFIDGNDSDIGFSGGTALFADNEFNHVVDAPKTLKNSAVIYNTKADYYHGFNFMKKNMFRKAIGIQVEHIAEKI